MIKSSIAAADKTTNLVKTRRTGAVTVAVRVVVIVHFAFVDVWHTPTGNYYNNYYNFYAEQ